MKKIVSLLLVFALLSMLAACASSKNIAASSGAPAAYETMDMMMSEKGSAAPQVSPVPPLLGDQEVRPGTGGGNAALTDRKIIKNVRMQMETKLFDEDLEKIIDAILASGGYIENQSVNGNSLYRDRSGNKTANIVARVPADKLDATGISLAEICNVLRQSSGSNDITDVYFDSDARLRSLTLQEERLLEILAKAQNLSDVIQLEQALSNTRYEIESLTAQLRRMDNQVSYSYLTVDLEEVVEYQHKEKTFAERLTASFSRSLRNIRQTLENGLFTTIEQGPVFILNLVIWAIVLWAAYRIARKLGWIEKLTLPKRKKKELPEEQEKSK